MEDWLQFVAQSLNVKHANTHTFMLTSQWGSTEVLSHTSMLRWGFGNIWLSLKLH